MSLIDPRAIIDPTAILADGVEVGPWSIIGAGVEIGEGTVIGPHVILKGPTRIGKYNRIYQFSSVGEDTPDLKYKGEETRLVMGDHNVIREGVTIHRGTIQDRSETTLGDHNLIMAYAHIGHDSVIGNHCILVNNTALAGHVHVEDWAILSGFTLVHQYCHIGAHSFSGMGTAIGKDVPAYVTVFGNPAEARSMNFEGMRRRGFSEDAIHALRRAYGVDVKYRTGVWNGAPVKTRRTELCEALSTLGVWVRLHYVYPYPHVDELIPLMAAGKILPYLDIPFQHASPKVLKSMKRPAFEDKTLARIKNWREICPDLIIRSTFIVGFPGETEEDFQYLLNWLTEAQLDRVGCFQYSPVEGAPANDLDLEVVPDDVKQDRWERFMAHQQAISSARLQMRIGREIEVLVDEVDEQGAVGRCFFDAPEIDGNVFIDNGSNLKPGDKVWCKVTDADEYDLWAEQI